jgi:hypothetical protein
MAELIDIPGIGKTTLELLEAAGFRDAESLANAGLDDLARELDRANSILKISKRTPGKAVVAKWIASARDLAGVTEQPEGPSLMPVNYELTPQVISMLAVAPFAIPLPARILMENQLGVSEIPPAILLNRYSGDLDVKVDHQLPKGRQPKQAAPSAGYVKLAEVGPARIEIDRSKLRSTDDMGEPMARVASIKTSPGNDRVALIRAPRTSTNEGRDPGSKWYIRGVLHSHPVAITLGAVVTLLLFLVTPLAVISAMLLLASTQIPQHFSWVPKWLLVFPLVLPVVGIFYLIYGQSGTCRICGQKLFAHRAHLKNSKAHKIRGLGYILPLCIHILLFRWFRCTHCGTPVRLKE